MSMVWLLMATAIHSQGVSKLFGLVGGFPQASQSSNGYLFSTDSSGNNFQPQYNFPVTVSGGLPFYVEMIPYNGKLYGTTSQGGSSNYGTIFEYDPVTNIYTKKIEFGPTVSITGGTPKGSLLLYNNKFYGLASEYGTGGAGCLFEWDPATNVYTKKFDFTGTIGAYKGTRPQNSLRLYNGKMYGTTQQGGTNNQGVVFEWDPATNTYTDLYDGIAATGYEFYNNITVYNNKLYGTSHFGGVPNRGVLFVIDPSLPNGSNYTVLKEFTYGAEGASVNGNDMIVYNNKLYGCLHEGGTSGLGTLFEYNPATVTFTKLIDFNGAATGGNPIGKLVVNGSKFLGLCAGGGANNRGAIFEWDPASPGVITKKADLGPDNLINAITPLGTLTLFNSKFYALSYNGGFVNRGTLFEYDYSTNTVIKKLNLDAAETGRIPYGKPILYNGKLYGTCYYGPQESSGTPYGCIWSFDPSTSTYTRKFNFDIANSAANGRGPVSSPIAYNGKLYGTTSSGGISGLGVFYEYDPVTEVYTKKDMQPIGGAFPAAEPIVYNNKLYGMTNNGGTGNNGIIYCYDPATGILSKVYDINTVGSFTPGCGFVLYNNLLYATTKTGGANNNGAIFSFDPATNTATSLYNLATATGININNALTVYNNKMYGTSISGGLNGRGCIFEFNPATNTVATLHNFISAGPTGFDPQGGLTVSGNKLYCTTTSGGGITNVVELDPATNTITTKSSYTSNSFNNLVTRNGLTVVPAFIANGIANSCETYPTIFIDATNNNKWVPILNSAGDVVAEIKANGNNLGNVNTSAYINNGTVREDATRQLYADRNISITVQNQPSTNVDIRLYLKSSEFLALKNALNSLGQPSGISNINDIAILKNNENCPSALIAAPLKLITTSENYEYGYVLSASISSFSTFFFAKNTFSVLPVRLLSFAASKCNSNVCLLWTVENEENFSHYEVEKSSSGNNFSSFNYTIARNAGSRTNYAVTDLNPAGGDNYYRLKMVDLDGRVSYSKIIRLNFSTAEQISIQPNPATDFVVVKGLKDYQLIRVVDMTGRIQLQRNIRQNIEELDISKLAKGIYIIELVKDRETSSVKLLKQ
ncbi:MAG: choice-of-anchor tandem repeat GloVer-containing protein [Chitinophagaceae bacterium]